MASHRLLEALTQANSGDAERIFGDQAALSTPDLSVELAPVKRVAIIAEAFLPTFGLVGIGGAVAFVLGSLFLFDRAETGIAVSRTLVFGAGGAFATPELSLTSAKVPSPLLRKSRCVVAGKSSGGQV